MSLPLGKLKKAAFSGLTLFTGAAGLIAGSTTPQHQRDVYDYYKALPTQDFVDRVIPGFDHVPDGFQNRSLFKEALKEVGLQEDVTFAQAVRALAQDNGSMSDMLRHKLDLAVLAGKLENGIKSGNLPTDQDIIDHTYGEQAEYVVRSALEYQKQNPDVPILCQPGSQSKIDLIPVSPRNESGVQGAVSGAVPDSILLRTNTTALQALLCYIHELGHTSQSDDMTKPVSQTSFDIISADDAENRRDNYLGEAFDMQVIGDTDGLSEAASMVIRKNHEHDKYLMTSKEVNTRLKRMKGKYFKVMHGRQTPEERAKDPRKYIIDSRQKSLDMLGAFGVYIPNDVLSTICHDHGLSNSGYIKGFLNYTNADKPNGSPTGKVFKDYIQKNRDIDELIKGINSYFGIKPIEKDGKVIDNREALNGDINGSIINVLPGLASNDASGHLGKHPKPLHAPTLDFREFMPGGQTGPGAGTIA